MARAYDGAALGGCGGSPPHESVGAIGGRRPADPYPCWSCGDSLGGGGVRVLVGAPVFKTGETEHLGLAGSIPVRLRRNLPREDRPRRAAAARPGRAPPVGPRGGPRAQDGGGRHHERSAAMSADPRRRIPRTDHLLAHPDVAAAAQVLSEHVVRGIVRGAQERARRGEIAAEAVLEEIRSALGGRPAGSPATGPQRDRGHRAHEPGPGAAVSCGARGAAGRRRLHRRRIRPRCRRPLAARRRRPRRAARRLPRGRGRPDRQQRGGRPGAGHHRPRRDGRGDPQPRRAHRDRRRLPPARAHHLYRSAAARGGHHQPHPPRGLHRGARPLDRLRAEGPHQQLPGHRLHQRGGGRRARRAVPRGRGPAGGGPRQRPARAGAPAARGARCRRRPARRRGPGDRQRRQAARRPAGRDPAGTRRDHRAPRPAPAGAGDARGQADPRRTRGHPPRPRPARPRGAATGSGRAAGEDRGARRPARRSPRRA